MKTEKIIKKVHFNKKSAVLYLAVVGFVALMFGAAGIIREQEIIFPEMLALLIGAWAAARQPWHVSGKRMVFVMGAAAFLGIFISRYVSVGLYGRVLCGLAAAYILLCCSKTTMAPLISACILPIMLGTKSMVYPVAVIVMVTAVVLGQKALERMGFRSSFVYHPVEPQPGIWCKRFLVSAVWFIVPLGFHMPYLAVPPLMVAFTELSEEKSPLREKKKELAVLFLIAALAGVFGRLFLTELLNLPAAAGGIFAAAVLLAVMMKKHLLFPPAGAAALLPFLLPADGLLWYPVWLVAGFVLCCAAADFTAAAWSDYLPGWFGIGADDRHQL